MQHVCPEGGLCGGVVGVSLKGAGIDEGLGRGTKHPHRGQNEGPHGDVALLVVGPLELLSGLERGEDGPFHREGPELPAGKDVRMDSLLQPVVPPKGRGALTSGNTA